MEDLPAKIRLNDYCYIPVDAGYDLICEILSEQDNGEIINYALNCGPIPFDCEE